MKVALVTAIYGDYDKPKPILPQKMRVTPYLYTDSIDTAHAASELGWNAVYDDISNISEASTPMLRAKYWKTHPLEAAYKYDYSIWIDGSMIILDVDFIDFCIAALGDDDISFTPHPLRRCIHPEASVTAALARYADCDPIAQVNHYRSIGHPDNWGLFASGAFTVKHSDIVREWGEHWWYECVNRTYQDQLSLPVVTRIMESKGLKWNARMPWAKWWGIANHGT